MQDRQEGPAASAIPPQAVVVMGVSGSGKSTLGAQLARMLGCRFIEGDELHDAASIAKMRSGMALSDADRWPWLDRLGLALHEETMAGGLVVATCSALKRSYRRRLEAKIGVPTSFIMLETNREELSRRLQARANHYMPASLLASQLEALERPGGFERALILDSGTAPDLLCRQGCDWLANLLD